jgi:hypothetical protein
LKNEKNQKQRRSARIGCQPGAGRGRAEDGSRLKNFYKNADRHFIIPQKCIDIDYNLCNLKRGL